MKHFVIRTLQQAKRVISIVVGFTVVTLGLIMLVTPGPGMVAVVAGLAILATEFVWARRLLKRCKDGAVEVKNSVLNNNERKKQAAHD